MPEARRKFKNYFISTKYFISTCIYVVHYSMENAHFIKYKQIYNEKNYIQ